PADKGTADKFRATLRGAMASPAAGGPAGPRTARKLPAAFQDSNKIEDKARAKAAHHKAHHAHHAHHGAGQTDEDGMPIATGGMKSPGPAVGMPTPVIQPAIDPASSTAPTASTASSTSPASDASGVSAQPQPSTG